MEPQVSNNEYQNTDSHKGKPQKDRKQNLGCHWTLPPFNILRTQHALLTLNARILPEIVYNFHTKVNISFLLNQLGNQMAVLSDDELRRMFVDIHFFTEQGY